MEWLSLSGEGRAAEPGIGGRGLLQLLPWWKADCVVCENQPALAMATGYQRFDSDFEFQPRSQTSAKKDF